MKLVIRDVHVHVHVTYGDMAIDLADCNDFCAYITANWVDTPGNVLDWVDKPQKESPLLNFKGATPFEGELAIDPCQPHADGDSASSFRTARNMFGG